MAGGWDCTEVLLCQGESQKLFFLAQIITVLDQL
jgi:hypothetical protein